jgi:hypothetical protein
MPYAGKRMPLPTSTSKPFVYSWGLRARAPISPFKSTLYLTPLGAAIVSYAAINSFNDPLRWLYIAIAAVLWILSITLILHPIIARRTIPASRIIKVHPTRRLIEFHNATFTRGLFRAHTLDRYDCPTADLRNIKFTRFGIQPHLTLDTPQGRVDITTRHDTTRLEELHLILRDLAAAPMAATGPFAT